MIHKIYLPRLNFLQMRSYDKYCQLRWKIYMLYHQLLYITRIKKETHKKINSEIRGDDNQRGFRYITEIVTQ